MCRQNLLPHSQRFEYVTTDLADRIRMLKKDTSTTTQATTPTPTDQRNLKNHKKSISSADVGCGAGSEVGSGSCSFGVQSSTRPVNHTYDHPVARDIARTCRSKKPTTNPPRNAVVRMVMKLGLNTNRVGEFPEQRVYSLSRRVLATSL